MAATLITVTGSFKNADGTAGAGTLQFQLSETIENADVMYAATPITVTLNGSGAFSVPLYANDDAATIPEGSTYTVIERVTSTSNREYSIVVPSAASGGAVDLSTLMPDQPGWG